MSNRQARRRRIEAVRSGDTFHKAARKEMDRTKAAEVARHNAAEAEERNRYRDAVEREQSRTALPTPPSSGRHLAHLQILALAMAALEGERR